MSVMSYESVRYESAKSHGFAKNKLSSENTPSMAITPPITQMMIVSPTLPELAATPVGEINIPEPEIRVKMCTVTNSEDWQCNVGT